MNEKDVNKGNKCLSAKEIIFSRDQLTGENLPIKDEEIADSTMLNRDKNNQYSSKSKASVQREAVSASAKKGQIVFLKDDGNNSRPLSAKSINNINESSPQISSEITKNEYLSTQYVVF